MTPAVAHYPRVSLYAGMLAAAGLPLYIHLPRFASVELGLDLAALGALLLVLRLIDLVQDPILGWLVDRWPNAQGGLALAAALGLSLGFLLLFTLPPDQSSILRLAAILILLFTAYSLGSILIYGRSASLALTADNSGLLRLAAYREAGILAGVVLAASAPAALAALGAYVPMISGRGLGHTGGTLDKLEAVPGVRTQVDETTLRDLLRTSGCAIVGASGRIAPADKRLYAIRDVTATVESLDLITASILSKKLAASPDALILDVKLGSGAFMKSRAEARALARSLTETAQAAGCACSAMITDMNQPLAPNLGNALEMRSAMAVLSGQGGALLECAALLGGRLLVDSGLAADEAAGQDKICQVIADGTAMERFCRMLTQMGAPADFENAWRDILPRASITRQVPAAANGYVVAIDGEVLGHAVVRLGGGRLVETDQIDPSVGLADMCRLGQRVSAGEPLCVVHASDEAAAEQAVQTVLSAITLGEDAPEPQPLLHERIG